jgi:hypothetical protein
MSYILEIETPVCINLFIYEKNHKGLKKAISRAETFFRLQPDSVARIMEGSDDREVWSSCGAKHLKESEIYLLKS